MKLNKERMMATVYYEVVAEVRNLTLKARFRNHPAAKNLEVDLITH